jgi:Leucine-rich repeat (LRR) protein
MDTMSVTGCTTTTTTTTPTTASLWWNGLELDDIEGKFSSLTAEERTSLRSLSLRGCSLTRIPSWMNDVQLPSLTLLGLESNRLDVLPEPFLHRAPHQFARAAFNEQQLGPSIAHVLD